MQHVIHTAAKCHSMHVRLQIFSRLQPCWHAAMRCGKHASAQTQPAWVSTVLLDSCWTRCPAAGQPSPANNSRTSAGHLSRVNIGLLDTLSSSWTFAGQANPVNMLLLDTCWTHCPAAGHLLDSQVLQIMGAGHPPRLGFKKFKRKEGMV